MSMMEFYPSAGTEENLSLQDMIEFDIKNADGDQWRAQTPNADFLTPLMDGYSCKTDSDLNGDNWMQLSQGSSSSGSGIQENTNPNLMVNPQTGVPIGQEQPPTPTPVTLTVSEPAVSTMRDSNPRTVLSLASQGRSETSQILRVTQPQFVNINNVMTVVASTNQGQQVLLQGNGSTVSSMSPLRQQLQNIHHLQPQQQHSPNVTYATTQQLLTQGLSSPQKITMRSLADPEEKVFPKPVYSYSCLIAMSLKNSDTGCLPVSEIYNFMTEHFPYFKTAPDGWKNSVRHNLSLNKCFEKIENPKSNGNTKKGCLWAMNPAKIDKMDEEISKWRKKDLVSIKRSMSKPEVLEMLEKGLGKPSLRNSSQQSSSGGGCPGTPVHDNNNSTKVISGSTATGNPVTAAILNSTSTDARGVVIKQEPRDKQRPSQQQQQHQTVSVNANVNVIELKPNLVKLEPSSKMEIDLKDLNNITFNSDDLNALDNSLALDPALGDIALQNGLFDDLGSDDLNLDAMTPWPSTNGISASPITVPTAGMVKMETDPGNPPPYLFTNMSGSLPSPPPYGASSQSVQLVRTVSAHT